MGVDKDNDKENNDENKIDSKSAKKNENENERETGDRPITILRNTLRWGHLCPTAPGTLILTTFIYLIMFAFFLFFLFLVYYVGDLYSVSVNF